MGANMSRKVYQIVRACSYDVISYVIVCFQDLTSVTAPDS